jgi:hypothetical protein
VWLSLSVGRPEEGCVVASAAPEARRGGNPTLRLHLDSPAVMKVG